jgi:hypothetical protein
VLLPARAGHAWSGVVGGDYDRLCARVTPSSPVRAVPFAGGRALGLETSGHQATYVRFERGIVVAKWIYAESPARAARALRAVPALAVEGGWQGRNRWTLVEPTVRLQPAAAPFAGASAAHLRFALEPGVYRLAEQFFTPDEETGFELFRLFRQ